LSRRSSYAKKGAMFDSAAGFWWERAKNDETQGDCFINAYEYTEKSCGVYEK
jgi:hypothetical protein